MEITTSAKQLASLGHAKRLSIFRRLVQAGPEGLSAGAIGEQEGLHAATLSFHLAHLSRVGLIEPRQDGRFIYYAARYAAMNALIDFLTAECCGGHPERCATTNTDITPPTSETPQS